MTWLQIMGRKKWMSAPNFIAINPAFVRIFVKTFPLLVVRTDTVKKNFLHRPSWAHVIILIPRTWWHKGCRQSERHYGKFATFKVCHRSKCPRVTHYSFNSERSGVVNVNYNPTHTNYEDCRLTWGAILMARQAADLGHDFYQCFYVLQYGAL